MTMVTLHDALHSPAKARGGKSYSTYQEPDTTIPPKARPLFDAVSVNGIAIAETAILAEAQNHPADNPGAALAAAARALVVRELLLQRAREGGIAAEPEIQADGKTETMEDAAIRQLIEEEVAVPSATAEECRRFFDRNPRRFLSDALYEARHILLAAEPSDLAARNAARATAEMLIAALSERPEDFETLAREYSACPSSQHGGNLGQLARGSTVREFELALGAMQEGETSATPVETRFGLHVIRLERRIAGRPLPFNAVHTRIAAWLEASAWSKAVSQYIAILAAGATIVGVDILAADNPLPS